MTGYKLFRKRRNGTFGPLFIGCSQQLEIGKTYEAENKPTKGFAQRMGWHICKDPIAPHLSKKNRVWCKVEFDMLDIIHRPAHQGSTWYLGSTMKILEELA